MRSHSVLSIVAVAAVGHVASQTTGELGDATIASNPAGWVYEAVLPEQPFFKAGSLNGNVQGSILAESAADGKGVQFTVKFSNLPQEGGPFSYHLHVDPVPEDGNCTRTLAHLDPFIRGEATECDAAKPETCQAGDLSGKHGIVDGDYEETYLDPFLSIVEGPGSFFGNRSFVFHFANKTRISCANFELVSKPTPPSNFSSTTPTTVSPTGAIPTGTRTPTNTGVPFLGAASASRVSFSLMTAALAAVMFML